MKAGVIVIVAVAVLGGGALLLAHNSSSKSSKTSQPSSSATSSKTTESSANTATPVAVNGVKAVSITADDSNAMPDTINVSRGDKVTVTFNVSSQGVYHGGLTFKSTDPVVQSDPIAPGSSGDVTFTATKSFKFTPYWYQSGVKKDYLVSVNVQ